MPDVTPRSVVLCDDAPDYLELVKLLLGMEPDLLVVGEAPNGQVAIDLCMQLRPDLLLLDISMPVMDGMTALPRIREVSPSTSVVMLTAFSDSALRQRALELGAAHFIEKGTSPGDLTAQLRSI